MRSLRENLSRVFDQVRHKLGRVVTEGGKLLEILDIETSGKLLEILDIKTRFLCHLEILTSRLGTTHKDADQPVQF